MTRTFGKTILAATAALTFMQSDPAVEAELMSATLHPYAIALQREEVEGATSSDR